MGLEDLREMSESSEKIHDRRDDNPHNIGKDYSCCNVDSFCTSCSQKPYCSTYLNTGRPE